MKCNNYLKKKGTRKIDQQLVDTAIKIEEYLIVKQNAVTDENKDITLKLEEIDNKLDSLKQKNELLKSQSFLISF